MIDNVGLYVYYKDEKELDPNFIRRCLIGRKETWWNVEADTLEKAVETFFREWEGVKISGDDIEEYKALWVNHKKPIEELPVCKLLCKNKRGELKCYINNLPFFYRKGSKTEK